MPVSKKPVNMPWITPYLIVSDAAKSLDFYSRAFGFEKRFEMKGPDGKIGHAEMQLRDGVIMLGPAMANAPNLKTPKAAGTRSVSIFVYVDDVDALCKRA